MSLYIRGTPEVSCLDGLDESDSAACSINMEYTRFVSIDFLGFALWPRSCFTNSDGLSDRAADHRPMLFVHNRMVRRTVRRCEWNTMLVTLTRHFFDRTRWNDDKNAYLFTSVRLCNLSNMVNKWSINILSCWDYQGKIRKFVSPNWEGAMFSAAGRLDLSHLQTWTLIHDDD